jgi:hypothetical protein
MNAAIGSKEADIIKAMAKLREGLNQASAKKTDKGDQRHRSSVLQQ